MKISSFKFAILLLCLVSLFPIPFSARAAGGQKKMLEDVQENPPIEKQLPPNGQSVSENTSGGQSHLFPLKLSAGMALPVTIEKGGAEVGVRILDSTGALVFLADSETGFQKTIPLSFIPKESGEFRLIVRSEGARDKTGQYRITAHSPREPNARDRAVMKFGEGLALYESEKFQPAYLTLEQAVEAVRAEGDPEFLAEALLAYGIAAEQIGRLQRAGIFYQEAMEIFRRNGFHDGETVASLKVLSIQGTETDPSKTLEAVREIVETQRASGRRNRVFGLSLLVLANKFQKLGDLLRATESATEALQVFQQLGNRPMAVTAMIRIGDFYRIGLKQAQADPILEEAVAEAVRLKSKFLEASAVTTLGANYTGMARHADAPRLTQKALDLWRELGLRSGEAIALYNLGLINFLDKKLADARSLTFQAIEILETSEEKSNLPFYYSGLGTIEIKLGDFDEGLRHSKQAVDMVEKIRDTILDPESRIAISNDLLHEVYEGYVECLMATQRAKPGLGYNRTALEVSERGRNRTLVEVLNSRKDLSTAGLSPALVEKRDKARREVEAASLAFSRASSNSAETGRLRNAFDRAKSDFEKVLREIEVANPKFARLASPDPLTVEDMQKLLDPDMVLVFYDVTEITTYIWVVSPKTFKAYRVFGRFYAFKAAREAYAAITERSRSPRYQAESEEQKAARLAEADKAFYNATKALGNNLGGEIFEQIKGKRVVIVADEALNLIPFAALPAPGLDVPLGTQCEITQLPSIGALAAIRRENAGRAPAPKTLAVWADPVFSPEDPRVKAGKLKAKVKDSPALLRSLGDVDGAERAWPPVPLPATRKEAEAISALVPQSDRIVNLGFSASRNQALAKDLNQYRYIHFATHSLINNTRPDLSGIVLSLVDQKGQPQDGFLLAFDVFNLKLSSEMVVLSGCRTGIGQENFSEGMIGLTRAFMFAGSTRVLVSLWSVSDEATSVLMADMYREMLGPKKLRPSAALREAQLKMMKDPRWASPFYWGAFVIQGEPR
jgi:CHAT domain-containing protein/Flp pilus assembly protein TadD